MIENSDEFSSPERKPRGRPRAEPITQASEDAPVPEQRRRRKAKVGGHALKLQAPNREGYVRRFVNARADRIAQLEDLGYSIVRGDTGTPNHGPGSAANRLAGTEDNGSPLRMILMETPAELYAEGVAELEEHNSKIDQAIRAGRDSTGRLSSQETYGQGSIKVER